MSAEGQIMYSAWALIIVAVVIGVIGIMLVKIEINSLPATRYDSVHDVLSFFVLLVSKQRSLLGGMCILFTPILYLLAFSRVELSIAYPVIFGLQSLFLLIGSALFLGESLKIGGVVGVLLILCGLYAISFSPGQ